MVGAALSTKTNTPKAVVQDGSHNSKAHGATHASCRSPAAPLPHPCRPCCSCTRSCCVHLAYSSVARRCAAGRLPPRRRHWPCGPLQLRPWPPGTLPSRARRAPWQRAHAPTPPPCTPRRLFHAHMFVSVHFVCLRVVATRAGGGGMDTVPQPRPPARVPATAAGCACQGYCFTGVTGRCPCMKAGRTCTPESCQGCTQVRSLCLPTVCACVRVCVRPAWCRGPVNQARRTPGTAACGVPGPLAPRPPHPIRWVVAVLPWCRRKSARP